MIFLVPSSHLPSSVVGPSLFSLQSSSSDRHHRHRNIISPLIKAILEIPLKLNDDDADVDAKSSIGLEDVVPLDHLLNPTMDPLFESASENFLDKFNRDFIDKWYIPLAKSQSSEFQDTLKLVLMAGFKGIIETITRKKQNEVISLITFGLASALIIHTKEYRLYEASGMSFKDYLLSERGKSFLSIPVFQEAAEMKHLKNLARMVLEKILPKEEIKSRLVRILGVEFFAGYVLHATIASFADPDWLNLKIVEFLGKEVSVDKQYLGMIKLKVMRAKNFPIDFVQRSIYCSISLGGSQMRTRIIEGDRDFIWNEEFRYNISDSHQEDEVFLLQVEVLQSGLLKQKLVGIINIPFSIAKLKLAPRTQKWFKFDQLPSVNSPLTDAEILLDIKFMTNNDDAVPPQTQSTSSAATNALPSPPTEKKSIIVPDNKVLPMTVIVQSSDLLVELMDFLEANGALKYLKFWMAVQALAKFSVTSETGALREDVSELYDVYLNAENPWCCLDVCNQELVKSLKSRLDEKVEHGMIKDFFMHLQKDIEAFLETDYLPSFRNSESVRSKLGQNNPEADPSLGSLFPVLQESHSREDSDESNGISQNFSDHSDVSIILNLRNKLQAIENQINDFNNGPADGFSDANSVDLVGLAKEKDEIGRELVYHELLFSKTNKMTVRVKPQFENQDSPFIIELWTLRDSAFLWSMTRRYSEFSRMHNQLKSRYPKASKVPFPAKPPLERLQSFSSTRQRDLCRELEKYLNMLVSDMMLGQSKILRDFLLASFGDEGGSMDGIQGEGQQQSSIVTGKIMSAFKSAGTKIGKIGGFFDRMETAAIKVVEMGKESRDRSKNLPSPIEPSEASAKASGSNDPTSPSRRSSVNASTSQHRGSHTSLYSNTDAVNRFKDADLDLLFESVFAIIENLFELNESEQWLRRKVLNIVKQYLRQHYSHLVEDLLNRYINQRPPEETAAIVVNFLMDQLWPNGQRWGYNLEPGYVPPPGESLFHLRTEEQKLVTKIEARALLTSHIPEALTRVLGSQNTAAGMTRLFNMIQYRTLNKHLLHVSFELVIKLFFGDSNHHRNK